MALSTVALHRSSSTGGGKTALPANALGAPIRSPSFPPPSTDDNDGSRFEKHPPTGKEGLHLYVLPVLLMEFLSISLTRAVLPSLMLKEYGDSIYIVIGLVDAVRGALAFFACPVFGKLSDHVGRKLCLFVTVLGTCAPCCCLAFFPWSVSDEDEDDDGYVTPLDAVAAQAEAATEPEDEPGAYPFGASNSGNVVVHPRAMTVFIVLLCLSGIFQSTFTLVFAYISDTVPRQEDRVSAYGLALATFGLSFTVGPMVGGYLARTNPQFVFVCSLVLVIVDLLYIYLILPESKQFDDKPATTTDGKSADPSMTPSRFALDPNISWNPLEAIRVLVADPFLRKVGQVAFLYYTGVWALISTFSFYAVKRFHLGPERLGELMSSLGLCTIVAEAVLVRFIVPLIGEKRSMKVGLVAFALQCIVLGFAWEAWHMFLCVGFSLLGNLVYPSLTSLISGTVEPEAVGEALGAVNGIKALTEGVGPLLFGTLMTLSENSLLPGWPYLVAAVFVLVAYGLADQLPDIENDDYVHELERKHRKNAATPQSKGTKRDGGGRRFNYGDDDDDDEDDTEDELDHLLSDIDTDDDEGTDSEDNTNNKSTFASFAIKKKTRNS